VQSAATERSLALATDFLRDRFADQLCEDHDSREINELIDNKCISNKTSSGQRYQPIPDVSDSSPSTNVPTGRAVSATSPFQVCRTVHHRRMFQPGERSALPAHSRCVGQFTIDECSNWWHETTANDCFRSTNRSRDETIGAKTGSGSLRVDRIVVTDVTRWKQSTATGCATDNSIADFGEVVIRTSQCGQE
jgi:hypothetical protein